MCIYPLVFTCVGNVTNAPVRGVVLSPVRKPDCDRPGSSLPLDAFRHVGDRVHGPVASTPIQPLPPYVRRPQSAPFLGDYKGFS